MVTFCAALEPLTDDDALELATARVPFPAHQFLEIETALAPSLPVDRPVLPTAPIPIAQSYEDDDDEDAAITFEDDEDYADDEDDAYDDTFFDDDEDDDVYDDLDEDDDEDLDVDADDI